MKKTIWDKRIPNLLGILLIVIGIGITSFFVNRGVQLVSRASPTETPLEIRISNVLDTSVTVSYTTIEPVPGIITYGKDKDFGQTAHDDKQQLGDTKAYKNHHITIRNLSPATKYYFAIISGKSTFLKNTVPFEVTTGPTLASAPTQQPPISGKVLLLNSIAPQEAIVYLTIPGAQTISRTVKGDGTYIIPLNSIRNLNLSSYIEVSPNTTIQMLFVDETLKSTVAILPKLANPVPIVTLSKNYDFTIGNTSLTTDSAEAVADPKITGFPSFVATEVARGAVADPKILTPTKNQGFSDQQPVFKGTATPNETVTITIHSTENIQAQIKTDTQGLWTFRPTSPLSPGQHTISIISRGKSGVLKTITQSFTVHAAGTQVTQTATPSATLTPTLSPTATPTPLPTSTPTPTIVLIPTATPTPFQIATSKGGQKIEPPGSSSLIPVGIVALGTTLVGVLLFILTRGGVPL